MPIRSSPPVSAFILPRALPAGTKSHPGPVQAHLEDLDLGELRGRLSKMAGVENVHDRHVWTLTSGMPVASAHLIANPQADRDTVPEGARQLLRDDFKIAHATLQVERGTEECAELPW